jgi:predicted chitinase
MSEWKDFLRRNDEIETLLDIERPGSILVNFVNRYLAPLDSIMYRIECEGKIVRGITTPQSHTVEVRPLTSKPIKVFVWSKRCGDFKMVTQINPRPEQRLLVSLRLKTFRHYSKTERHPSSHASQTSKESTVPSGESAEGWDVAEQGVELAISKNNRNEPEHKVKRLQSDKILTEQLKKVFPAADETLLREVADELNFDLPKYKLDTPLRRAHFFAQVRQEAGPSFSPKQECFNYRPEVLVEKFDYYRKRPQEARDDGRLLEPAAVLSAVSGTGARKVTKNLIHPADQQAIANKAYGSRDGNGDVQSGDGWRFRGRGIFQLTLRSNYAQFTEEYSQLWSDGAVNFLLEPDKICVFPYFVRSAVWFWVRKGVYAKADGGAQDANINNVTRVVNGSAMDAATERRLNFHELSYPVFK